MPLTLHQRDRLTILDELGPQITECAGGRAVASGLSCPHCDSSNPSEECFAPLTDEQRFQYYLEPDFEPAVQTVEPKAERPRPNIDDLANSLKSDIEAEQEKIGASRDALREIESSAASMAENMEASLENLNEALRLIDEAADELSKDQ